MSGPETDRETVCGEKVLDQRDEFFAAPMVPPQGAFFAFVGLLLLGGTAIVGYRAIVTQLSNLETAVQEPDEEPEPEAHLGSDPIEELRERYAQGELTDEEFEDELEEHMINLERSDS